MSFRGDQLHKCSLGGLGVLWLWEAQKDRVCALSVDGGGGLNLASLLTRGGWGTSVRHKGPPPR